MTPEDPVTDNPDAELVIGLVAPVGTDTSTFADKLGTILGGFGYSPNCIRLSHFLRNVLDREGNPIVKEEPEVERISSYMTAGNELRKATNRHDILALMTAAHIKLARKEPPVLPRTAHLLLTLKHPEEVQTLRRVYGDGFYLVGVYASERDRHATLCRRHGMSDEDARDTICRDGEEAIGHGQHTRDTFQLADVFVPAGGDGADAGLHRFLDLVFGCPFITPTPDEHAMFMAYASSVRSGSLPRQVGAVIVSVRGEIIATGSNDAPKAGGGPYWPGPDDERDLVRGRDSNAWEIKKMLEDAVRHLRALLPSGPGAPSPSESEMMKALRASRFEDITEFGRDVHAEMDALLACSRNGAPVGGATLFTTTFPCHNCAKHIISAGIAKVVFVEPYPKSKALSLHDDALVLEGRADDPRVELTPFIGIGPRRYLDLFSLRLGSGPPVRRKKDDLHRAEWQRSSARPRVAMMPFSYLDQETAAERVVNRLVPSENTKKGDAS